MRGEMEPWIAYEIESITSILLYKLKTGSQTLSWKDSNGELKFFTESIAYVRALNMLIVKLSRAYDFVVIQLNVEIEEEKFVKARMNIAKQTRNI